MLKISIVCKTFCELVILSFLVLFSLKYFIYVHLFPNILINVLSIKKSIFLDFIRKKLLSICLDPEVSSK